MLVFVRLHFLLLLFVLPLSHTHTPYILIMFNTVIIYVQLPFPSSSALQ